MLAIIPPRRPSRDRDVDASQRLALANAVCLMRRKEKWVKCEIAMVLLQNYVGCRSYFGLQPDAVSETHSGAGLPLCLLIGVEREQTALAKRYLS